MDMAVSECRVLVVWSCVSNGVFAIVGKMIGPRRYSVKMFQGKELRGSGSLILRVSADDRKVRWHDWYL